MKTHLGPHPNWKSTDIPYSSLAPEVVSGMHIHFTLLLVLNLNIFAEKEEKNRQ